MSIYSYQNVTDFLYHFQVTCRPNRWPWWFQTHQPAVYNTILAYTDHLVPRNFTDRLYCYTNQISQRPGCRFCGAAVSYDIGKKQHHEYCSQRCSMKDLSNVLGVQNVSQLASVKQKKKKTALLKYGVDNVSKANEIKNKIGVKAKARWAPFWDGVSHQGKDQYVKKVSYLTDRNYRKYKHILDPEGLRSPQWHLDHLFSKSDGFRYQVDPAVVSHPANLRIISGSANSSKNFRSDISLQVLAERIEVWERTHTSL